MLLVGALAAAAPALPKVVVAAFSEATPGAAIPEGFETLSIDDDGPPTAYSIVRDSSGTPVVKAVASNAATGLVKRQTIDLEEYPVLEWRWNAERVLDGGNVNKKAATTTRRAST